MFKKTILTTIAAAASFGACAANPAPAPDETQLLDMRKAAHIASEIGRLDIGQGCVVVDGLVLAVEAQEGTDGMLARLRPLASSHG